MDSLGILILVGILRFSLFTVMGQNTGPGGCLFKEVCPGCFEDSKLIFSKVLSVKCNCAAFPKDFLTPFISANH